MYGGHQRPDFADEQMSGIYGMEGKQYTQTDLGLSGRTVFKRALLWIALFALCLIVITVRELALRG